MVTLAICGPKYNTKVCSPVPKPTLDMIPSTIHHDAKYTKSRTVDRYYKGIKSVRIGYYFMGSWGVQEGSNQRYKGEDQ